MKTLDLFKQQLREEAVTTRKMLRIVPQDKFSWQPHAKSMTLQYLVNHIADLPGWIVFAVNQSEWDLGKHPENIDRYVEVDKLLEDFDMNYQNALKAMENTSEEELEKEWALRNGSDIYYTASKRDVILMVLSQIIHHRAQLGVFLRLLDVPIPGSYGPSADDNFVSQDVSE